MIATNQFAFNIDIWNILLKLSIFVYGSAYDKLSYIFLMIVIEGLIDFMLAKKSKSKEEKKLYEFFKKFFGYSVFIFLSGAVDVIINTKEVGREMMIVLLFILQFFQILIKLSLLGFEKEVRVISIIYQKMIKTSAFGKEIAKDLNTNIETVTKKQIDVIKEEIKLEELKEKSSSPKEEGDGGTGDGT